MYPLMQLRKYLVLMLALLPIFSCTKDELNRPVEAELLLEINTPDLGYNPGTGAPSETIEVNGGQFVITSLGFDGYRESGENYFFSKTFPDSLKVTFTQSTPGRILQFEMPQGVYKRIDVSLALPAGKELDSLNEEIDKAALRGGVELWGLYRSNQDIAIPFLFIYSAADAFRFTAQSGSGSQQVVVKDNRKYQVRLQFDPQKWMELINPRMLQSGKLSILNGVPTIVISKNHNQAIYNLLVNRIEQSANLLFE